MIDATHRASSRGSIPNTLRTPANNQRGSSSSSFSSVLADSGLSTSGSPAGVSNRYDSKAAVHRGTRGQGRGSLLSIDVTKPQTQGTSTKTKSLLEIPMNEPAVPVSAREATPSPDAGSASSQPVDAITALDQALAGAGIDITKLSISRQELQASYPGGNYVLHGIQVSTADGRSVMLDAGALENPYGSVIAACDVQHMLQG